MLFRSSTVTACPPSGAIPSIVPVHDLAGDRANGQAGPNSNPKTDDGTREGCVPTAMMTAIANTSPMTTPIPIRFVPWESELFVLPAIPDPPIQTPTIVLPVYP